MTSRASIPDEIRNRQGERIATTFVAGAPERNELVVIGHGFTSDKERPWSEGISNKLAAAGVASLRIAFPGNGASEGAFADATITKEVGDLTSVIDALGGWRVSYVGHSMGGSVGVLFAARDARLHSLVTLAAVTNTAEFFTRMFGHLEPGDVMLDKPQCRLSAKLRDDFLAIGTTMGAAREVRVPWFIAHGTSDDVVPIEHSHDLRAAAREADFVALEGVDHSFSGAGLPAMLEAVVPWLVARHAR